MATSKRRQINNDIGMSVGTAKDWKIAEWRRSQERHQEKAMDQAIANRRKKLGLYDKRTIAKGKKMARILAKPAIAKDHRRRLREPGPGYEVLGIMPSPLGSHWNARILISETDKVLVVDVGTRSPKRNPSELSISIVRMREYCSAAVRHWRANPV